jgi:ribosome-binding factor A
MPQGARTDRVGEEFREILAEEIQRLKDPRVGFITVTGVDVTHDLKRARVSYTAYGDEKSRKASGAALRSATPHLRRALGRQVRLKVVPELVFEVDASLERGQRIEQLLGSVSHELHRDDEGEETP